MGLDCTHDAFHGAYSAFRRFRQVVARAVGGSYPDHYIYGADGEALLVPGSDFRLQRRDDLDPDRWYWGDGYSRETHPGLYEFFCHDDCCGEINPDLCAKLAYELEALLPEIERAAPAEESGHIAREGGYVEVTRKFIAGCRAAAEAGEPLGFH